MISLSLVPAVMRSTITEARSQYSSECMLNLTKQLLGVCLAFIVVQRLIFLWLINCMLPWQVYISRLDRTCLRKDILKGNMSYRKQIHEQGNRWLSELERWKRKQDLSDMIFECDAGKYFSSGLTHSGVPFCS